MVFPWIILGLSSYRFLWSRLWMCTHAVPSSLPPPGYSNVGISRWFVLIFLKFKEADRNYLIKAQKDNSAID